MAARKGSERIHSFRVIQRALGFGSEWTVEAASKHHSLLACMRNGGEEKGRGERGSAQIRFIFLGRSLSPFPSIHHTPLLFIVVILSVAEELHAFFRDTFFPSRFLVRLLSQALCLSERFSRFSRCGRLFYSSFSAFTPPPPSAPFFFCHVRKNEKCR